MDITTFIFGIIVGYFIEKFLDFILDKIRLVKNNYRWKKAEETWRRYQSLSFGLEVIQAGWKAGVFSEEQVVVTLDDVYEMPKEYTRDLYDNHIAEWKLAGLENNVQYGICEIDPHRVLDEIATKVDSHQLRIKGHTYHYFEFMATHRLYLSGTPAEQDLLINKIGEPHYLEPVSSFPNPLSVGLSLFCENGNYIVLTKRTKIASSGGLWSGNTVYNAVGENMTSMDTYGIDYQGRPRLSPWLTAKRGLREEMGIEFYDKKMSLILNSFVWDNRILDYKFFGYTLNTLSQADVRKAWINAPDRQESREIMFFDCSNDAQVKKLIKEIIANREVWASECVLCTVLSLLHLGKISPAGLDKIISTT